jgi:hypothetical protein
MYLVLARPVAAAAFALLAAAASAQPTADAPWSAQGRLEDGDSVEDGHRYDDHRLRLEAGQRYRISASSDDFDTLIRLYRTGEAEPVAENDDFDVESGLNSRISYSPQESGDYTLRVLSFSEDGRGAYAAGAETLPPLPAPVSGRPDSRPRLRWQVWQGELTESDPDRDGARFDDYLVPMRAGETRLISAEAAGFDTMIWVMRAAEREGEPLEVDDDSGPGLNSLLGFQPDADGDYIVRVTSYGAGGSGAYRLRVSDPVMPAPPLATSEPEPMPPEPDETGAATPPGPAPADAPAPPSAG